MPNGCDNHYNNAKWHTTRRSHMPNTADNADKLYIGMINCI